MDLVRLQTILLAMIGPAWQSLSAEARTTLTDEANQMLEAMGGTATAPAPAPGDNDVTFTKEQMLEMVDAAEDMFMGNGTPHDHVTMAHELKGFYAAMVNLIDIHEAGNILGEYWPQLLVVPSGTMSGEEENAVAGQIFLDLRTRIEAKF